MRTNEGRVSVPLLVGNSMKGLLLGWLKIADKIPGEIPAQKRKEESTRCILLFCIYLLKNPFKSQQCLIDGCYILSVQFILKL